jgi:hypothetical protein
MTASKISDQVRGKTIRLTWTDGPTKGTAQDHVFHADGTVEWHAADDGKKEKPAATDSAKTAKKAERPAYAGAKISDGVCLISYLSQSGYTLTVVLNFGDGSTVGVASNEKTWVPVKGTFEVLG